MNSRHLTLEDPLLLKVLRVLMQSGRIVLPKKGPFSENGPVLKYVRFNARLKSSP
jgi:hypothetical protein